MFTGLISERGTLRRIEKKGDVLMTIAAKMAGQLSVGDSVSVNGICLTVREASADTFTVSLSAETLRCSTAGNWREGQQLNLEPALRLSDPLGGHFVAGHIDGVAVAISATKSGDSTEWMFETATELMRFIAPKGSVTLDGVSLTVNAVHQNTFTVNIIAHTAAVTSFADLQLLDKVNLEVDLLARYLVRLRESAA